MQIPSHYVEHLKLIVILYANYTLIKSHILKYICIYQDRQSNK